MKSLYLTWMSFLSLGAAAHHSSWSQRLGAHLPQEILPPFTKLFRQAAADLSSGKTSTVRFVSDESTKISETLITNEVSRHLNDRAELWLMRQRQSSSEGNDSSHWSLVAIYVDKNLAPPKAYYSEFAAQPFAAGGALPEPITPRVNCLRCHPNGPRALRPQLAPDEKLSAASFAVMLQWNQAISHMGPVVSHPLARTEKNLRPEDPLKLAKCTICHSTTSGIRSPLSSLHQSSIDYLTKNGRLPNGYMSDDAAPDMPAEEDLGGWQDHGQPKTARVVSKQKHLAKENALYHVDPVQSSVKIGLHTSFTTFSLAEVKVSGHVAPKGSECQAEVFLDFSAATTGIRLRDRHMHQWVPGLTQGMKVTLQAFSCAALSSDQPFSLAAELSFGDTEHREQLSVQCFAPGGETSKQCTLTTHATDLRQLGMELPRFLNLQVLPKATVSAQLFLF